MATKSYSKHKEFREFSTSRSGAPYSSDEQFDIIKSELLPKNSKLHSLTPGGGGGGGSDSEYFYEYHEDKHPSGKYEKKDLHTVEQYTIPNKSNAEQSSYYYKREDKSLPAINSSANYEYSSSTPGYSRIKSSKKETSQNVGELDSLLDDLQKDQERQVYKSGYTSDTAESTGYEYRKTSTPVKSTPSSGYSTLKTEQRMEEMETKNWRSSPLPPPKVKHSEFTKEMYREETGNWRSTPVPPPKVIQSEFTNEMYREEKTESRVVPSQISPALPQPVPAPICHQCQFPATSRPGAPMNKVTTTVKTYTYELPADQDPTSVPIPEVSSRYVHDSQATKTTTSTIPASPSLGCQYCSHCNTRISHTQTLQHQPPPQPPVTTSLREHRVETSSELDRVDGFPRSERMVYPAPANEVRTPTPSKDPNGPTTYKWSETSYSEFNTTERRPVNGAPASPPFPRPQTPVANEQLPKKLDDLLAEFPEARFPTQPDGVTQRRVEVLHESKKEESKASKNVAGPAVYYPPNHQPFQKKEEYAYGKASAEGGKWAAGRGMYEYESGAKSKEKSSESKKVVPVCLPLCCAMPCSIM